MTSILFKTEQGFSCFLTLPVRAEGVRSKNKTHVPPGLWEQGPPAYCFGIWGRTGRIWPRQRFCRVDTDGRRVDGGRAAVLSRKELRKYSRLQMNLRRDLFLNVNLQLKKKIHYNTSCIERKYIYSSSDTQIGFSPFFPVTIWGLNVGQNAFCPLIESVCL